MRRRPIPILLALALAVGLGPAAAQALPESAVVHEAATEDELVAAAAAVNADDTGTPQAIRLTGDIVLDGSSHDELVFTHDVTLLGGGHSIDLGSWGLVAQDGAQGPGRARRRRTRGEARTASEPCGPPPSMPAAYIGRCLPRAPAARRW